MIGTVLFVVESKDLIEPPLSAQRRGQSACERAHALSAFEIHSAPVEQSKVIGRGHAGVSRFVELSSGKVAWNLSIHESGQLLGRDGALELLHSREDRSVAFRIARIRLRRKTISLDVAILLMETKRLVAERIVQITPRVNVFNVKTRIVADCNRSQIGV